MHPPHSPSSPGFLSAPDWLKIKDYIELLPVPPALESSLSGRIGLTQNRRLHRACTPRHPPSSPGFLAARDWLKIADCIEPVPPTTRPRVLAFCPRRIGSKSQIAPSSPQRPSSPGFPAVLIWVRITQCIELVLHRACTPPSALEYWLFGCAGLAQKHTSHRACTPLRPPSGPGFLATPDGLQITNCIEPVPSPTRPRTLAF